MLLKTEEVAKLLRVSTRRLQQMTEEGLINPIRIGQQALRYKIADIAELTDQTEDEIIKALKVMELL